MSAVLDTLSSLLGGSAPPSVRVPGLEVSFGGASADDWAAALVSVTVEAGVAPAVDAADIVLAAGAGVEVALGDAGSVALGFGDSGPDAVFAGAVGAVHRSLSGETRIAAVDGGAALAALRMNRSYEKRTAGDIVRDLAGEAGADAGSIEDGPKLPFYVVDDGRSGWMHIADLAAKSGFLARFAPGGSLEFGPASEGAPAQTFAFAQDVLALDAAECPPAAGAITVVGEGAAGTQGDAAWSRLVKDPSGVTGTAGSGDPARLLRDRSLRTLDAASGAAEAAAARAAAGATTARLLVPGAPKATVGASVAVQGTPDGALDGTYVVRGVRHRYTKREGFASLLLLSRSGGAGGGGLASLVGGLL
jgi:phage protein D